MSVFADGYTSYLNYAFNYNDRLNFLSNIFEGGYEACRNPKFLTKDFLDNLNNFPMFPYFFNIMSGMNNIKIISIYNLSTDTVDRLDEVLLSKPNISRLKARYNLIPQQTDDIVRNAYYQYAFLSGSEDIYSKSYFFRSYLFERNYRNFFSYLYSDRFCSVGETASSGIENSSFLVLENLRNCIFLTLFNSCNLSQKLLDYLHYFDISGPDDEKINSTNFATGMSSFISSYENIMSDELVDLITKALYGFINISTPLKNNLSTVVRSRVATLSTIFSNFLNTVTFDLVYSFIGSSVDLLYSIMSADILSKIYNNNNIINQSMLSSVIAIEDDIFSTLMGEINSVNIEPYLFVSYFYKFWPSKFVNVLPLCLQKYTEDVIKPPSKDALPLSQYQTILGNFFENSPVSNPDLAGEYLFPTSKINYNALRSFLTSTITLTPVNYLSTLSDAYQIPRFTCVLYYLELFDQFFKTKIYDTFVSDLLHDIFVYLRDNGHINYTFNWIDYHSVVDIYLKTYIRYKILNSSTGTELFQNITNNYTAIFNRVLTNTTDMYAPFPHAGTYDILVNISPAIDINSTFKNMSSGIISERMHQFSENMILSVLTREIIYGAFDYFIV